jgi:hypothetical protein
MLWAPYYSLKIIIILIVLDIVPWDPVERALQS